MEKRHLADGKLLQGGKYKIVRFLNSGGFGCTYEALHTQFDSRVAIKEFFIETFCNRNSNTGSVSIATDSQVEIVEKLRKKFVDEAKMVFQMHQKHPKKYHPNIVHVIDIFDENGTAYYVMDFIEGKSLNDMVKTRGPLPEQVALRYIRQVADALKYVHSFNRLHLDVKPGNIMIDGNNDAILIDFGASKHYDEESGENTSSLLGINTKGYAPVEQQNASFKTFSPATDIYALGATLYKLLTGITPPDAASLLSEESFLQPLPTTISQNTRNAVNAAMQLKRKDRPQSIDEFLAILDGKSFVKPKVIPVETDEATQLDDENDDEVEVLSVQAGNGNNDVEEEQNNTSEWGEEEKKKSPLAIIAIALACAVVVGLIVYFAMPKSNSGSRGEMELATTDTLENVERPELTQEITPGKEEAGEQGGREESQGKPEQTGGSAAQESGPTNNAAQEGGPTNSAASQQTQTNQQAAQQSQSGKPKTGMINGHEYVDLGLSVKWATCNVGASSPTGYGDYYAWGETSTKSEYTEENSTTYGKNLGDIEGKSGYDVARAKWGGSWRLPTASEIDELKSKCKYVWTTQGGVNGYKVTGPNGNSIFLPAAGCRYGSSLDYRGEYGIYWGSTPDGTGSAYYLGFYSGNFSRHSLYREDGRSVRAVSE